MFEILDNLIPVRPRSSMIERSLIKYLPVKAVKAYKAQLSSIPPHFTCVSRNAHRVHFSAASIDRSMRRTRATRGRSSPPSYAPCGHAGKILSRKNSACPSFFCERDSLECVCQRADVRGTRVALHRRFLDYRVTRGKAEKDSVETREGGG